jgi:hypothetical protein
MPKISAKLQDIAKTDNNPAAHRAKVAIRRNVLAAIGADQAHVFDAFAGAGAMHGEVWGEAHGYVGCDERFYRDERLAYVGDNRRVLRALDLRAFNVFDLDAYGCPWEQAIIIAERRPLSEGETVGFVITEGQGMKMRMGGMSHALGQLAGIRRRMPGMATSQDQVMSRATRRLAERMGATIAQQWQAIGKLGSRMYYIGLVLRSDQPSPG